MKNSAANLFYRNTAFLKMLRQALSEQLLYETDESIINEIFIIIDYLTTIIISRRKKYDEEYRKPVIPK